MSPLCPRSCLRLEECNTYFMVPVFNKFFSYSLSLTQAESWENLFKNCFYSSSEIEFLFCKWGSLCGSNPPDSPLHVSFSFYGLIPRKQLPRTMQMCHLIAKRCALGTGIWPTNEQNLQKVYSTALSKMFFSPNSQPKICILTEFLYLVCARCICSGLYISIWASVGLCCSCVSCPHRAKFKALSFTWRSWIICVWQADVLLCVSLLKFRLCLITRKHGYLAFLWHSSFVKGKQKKRVVWPWEQCPMSGVPELFSQLLRQQREGVLVVDGHF